MGAENLKRLGDLGNDVVGSDEVDVLGALFLEAAEERGKVPRGHAFALFGTGDLEVLAENAAERASRKKDRPAPHVGGEEGLLEGMKVGLGDGNALHAARARPFCSVRPAPHGTKKAPHEGSIARNFENVNEKPRCRIFFRQRGSGFSSKYQKNLANFSAPWYIESVAQFHIFSHSRLTRHGIQ